MNICNARHKQSLLALLGTQEMVVEKDPPRWKLNKFSAVDIVRSFQLMDELENHTWIFLVMVLN